MTGPYFGMIPRRIAGLRLPGREHAVLDVIAIHTDKNSGLAWPSLETIARETGLHKRKVPARICRLVEEGVLQIVQRGGKGIGGRGRANVYQIIPDEEAARRASQAAVQADAAAKAAAVNGALPGPESAAENSALFGSETVPFLAVNGALPGTPSEKEQKLEQNLPCGEGRARAREGGEFLLSGSVGCHQPAPLLPINGSKASLAAGDVFDPWETFRPRLETIAVARQSEIGDVEKVVNDWRDWNRANGKPFPADPDASLRRWFRNEPKFSRSRVSPSQPGRSSLIETLLKEAEETDGD